MDEPGAGMDVDDDSYQPPKGLGRAVVSQIVGQLGGFAVAGPAGAAIAPVITTALDMAIAEIRRNGRRQVDTAMDVAVTRSGLDQDELLERLVSSPAHMAMLLEAVEAAARTADARVLNALGRGLANAATDGARLDHETLVAKAYRELGPGHFRLMRGLLRPAPFFSPPSTPEDVDTSMAMKVKGNRASVLDVDPLLADSWDALLAGLVRHGAVVSAERSLEDPRFGFDGEGLAKQRLSPEGWRVTPFGAELYRRVLIAGQDEAPPRNHDHAR
jgi:hypothetical protein